MADHIAKLPNRPFVAGLWLIATIPLALIVAHPSSLTAQIDEGIRAVLMLSLFIGTAYMWAKTLASRSGLEDSRSFNIAAAITFPLMIIAVYAGFEIVFGPILNLLNVMQTVEGTHAEFVVIFVIWTGLVAGVSGFALGLAQKDWKLALQLLAIGFIVGALVFYIVVLIMQQFGFWVGIPRPDGLPNMPIITLLGIWSAALIGSELFGRLLTKSAS